MRPNSPTVTVLNLFETHHFFLAWQVKAPLSLLCISCQFHLQVLLCELSYTLPTAHQSAPVTTKGNSQRNILLWRNCSSRNNHDFKGAFHLSDLTGQTISVAMIISNPRGYSRRRTFFRKILGKSLFLFQTDWSGHGPAHKLFLPTGFNRRHKRRKKLLY